MLQHIVEDEAVSEASITVPRRKITADVFNICCPLIMRVVQKELTKWGPLYEEGHQLR